MGKIKKIIESELVGGTQNTDVYPVTSTKAVYDTNNKVLEDYIQHLKKTHTFAGIATPATNPGVPDGPVFYIAKQIGVYSNFNNIEIQSNDICLFTYFNNIWVKESILSAYTKTALNKASSGNYTNTYISKATKVGGYIEVVQTQGSVSCTNLLGIRRAEFSDYTFRLENLYRREEIAPSYCILDKNYKVLSIIKGVNSADINTNDLDKNAYYIVANSESITEVVTSTNSVLDTGVSVKTILDSIRINDVETKVKSNKLEIDNIKTHNYQVSTITTKNIKSVALNPVTGNFLISRIIYNNGGTIKKLNLEFDVSSKLSYKVYVALKQTDTEFKIHSVTDIEVSSKEIDLSDYNIDIPAGECMVSLLITNGHPELLYGNRSIEGDIYESKSIYLGTQIPSVGESYYIYGAFPYITANFYFTIEASLPLRNTVSELEYSVKDINNKISDDAYKNKHVVVFGDSITWYGHDDCTGERGWTKYFKEHFNFASIRSYARSGATLTATENTTYDIVENTGIIADNNCLYNQVNRMIDAINKGTQVIPDYIFVALGTNDFQRGLDKSNNEIIIADELGKDYSKEVNINTCTTYIKAMRFFHDQIWNVTKDAQIIILTPLQRGEYLSEMEKAAIQIRKCAEYLAWPVIDQFRGSMMSSVSESLGHKKNPSDWDYTPDGLHPSARGAKFIGDWISQQAKSILRV